MKQIGQLVREMIPVIIGILIALLINNWNEDRKDRKYLDQIFSSILKESEESIADIDFVLPKQQALIDTIETYLDNEKASIIEIVMKANGTHKPDIKLNSWRAIANSKIELIEYEKLSTLSDIEERKDNLYARIDKTADFLLMNITETSREKKELLKMMTFDVINAEKRLKSRIEDFLKE